MLLNKTEGTQFTTTSLLLIYSETFQPHGTVGNQKFTDLNYLAQPLVMISSFLGLPNNRRLYKKLSFLDILKNMIGWSVDHERNDQHVTAGDVLKAIPFFLFFVTLSLIRIVFNIAKLVTEFLPALIEENCRLLGARYRDSRLDTIATAVYLFFNFLHFLGRAVTSPVKGFLNKHQNSDIAGASLLVSVLSWGLIVGGIVSIFEPVLWVGVAMATGLFTFSAILFASSNRTRQPEKKAEVVQTLSNDTTTSLQRRMPRSNTVSLAPAPTRKSFTSIAGNNESTMIPLLTDEDITKNLKQQVPSRKL